MKISPLQVMSSAAGHYVGHGYNPSKAECESYGYPDNSDEEGFYPLPYSRESDYFATKEKAQAYLDYLTQDEPREEVLNTYSVVIAIGGRQAHTCVVEAEDYLDAEAAARQDFNMNYVKTLDFFKHVDYIINNITGE